MFEFFKKPHPFIFSVYSLVIPSTITCIVIAVLAPFYFQKFTLLQRLVSASIIAIIVALVIWISVYSLKKVFPSKMSEDKWTIGKEFLLIVFVLFNIAVVIFIILLLIQPSEVAILPLFLRSTSITIAISLLPILVSILFEQYKYQKTQLKKANILTEYLKVHTTKLSISKSVDIIEPTAAKQPILIKSENHDIVLQLNPQDLIYLKSDGNYVEVYFNNSESTQKKVVRNRLKTIESILPNSIFFRCHNSFIVNGNHIIKVEGNARSLILFMKGIPEAIPVSRTKAKIIEVFIENLQK